MGENGAEWGRMAQSMFWETVDATGNATGNAIGRGIVPLLP